MPSPIDVAGDRVDRLLYSEGQRSIRSLAHSRCAVQGCARSAAIDRNHISQLLPDLYERLLP
jgi:hypothetical protein